MNVYSPFINENTAIDGASRIGVYKNGNKIGYIPLSDLNKKKGKKLYTFGAVSDLHLDETGAIYKTTVQDCKKAFTYYNKNVDFLCICGDLSDHGERYELEFYKYMVDTYIPDIPVYVATGNHEQYEYTSSEYYEELIGTPLYYTFERGNDLFIMLGVKANHEYSFFAEGELDWLQNTLEQNRNRRCFLFLHIPTAEGSGDPLNIYTGNQFGTHADSLRIKSMLERYKNLIHFHGHSHFAFHLQEYSKLSNYDNIFGTHSVHIPSLTVVRGIDFEKKTMISEVEKSEGYIVDVYEDGLHLKGYDFINNKYIPVASYWLDTTIVYVDNSDNPQQAVARKIQNYQSPTTLTCSLMSDVHYAEDKYNSEKCLTTAQTMGLMQSYMKQDFIGNLGDMIPGDVDAATSLMYMETLAQSTNQNAKCPVFYARGNHDDNGWYSHGGFGGTYKTTEIFNDEEWYQSIFNISAKDLVIDENRPNGGYGYFDHEASKIRVFVMNTEDLPYIVKDDGTYRYNSYSCGHSLSNEQINFVANALYFADKENPKEWAALFLSHVPFDTTNDDGYRFGIKDALIRGHEYFLAVVSAYRKGSAFSASGSTYNSSMGDVSADFNVSVDVDYTTKGGGDVIAFVSGHTHADNFSSLVGTEGSLSRGYAYLGLMGSTDFANFVFDRENNRICAVKYGNSIPDTTEGAAVEAPDTGSIEDGEWTVNIDQFRPDGANLYAGLSEVHSSGSLSSATKVNTSTLEVDAVAAQTGYIPTKAIALKPFTRYAIPSSWNGQLLAFGLAGGKSSYITPTAADGYKYFQTGIRQYYVVFAHHIGSYTDYANFWIKEMGEGVEYN